MPKCWLQKKGSITKEPKNTVVTPSKNEAGTVFNDRMTMEMPTTLLADKEIT